MNAYGKVLDQTADWSYLTAAPGALKDGQFSPVVFREVLDRGTELLKERFEAEEAIEDLVRDRARLVDITLRAAWVQHAGKFADDLALIAVGGYGRGELHPSSDIDIMVLLPKSDSADWQPDIERFLTFLWDIGLEVGHSVRSIDDCQRESLADISVATTLFEARLLAGPESLFAGMRRALAPDRLWSSQDFFEAKVKEQIERHHRYFDTAYNLEPNVKSSPGGLRDIQTIGWVAKRHFGTDTLDELVRARIPDPRGTAQAQGRRNRSCGGCASGCTCSPDGAKTGCCSTIRSSSRKCSATKTRASPWRSNS